MEFRRGVFGWSYVAVLFLVGLATFAVHESAHWLAGTALGYPMVLTPNQVWSRTPMEAAHAMWVDAAGPLLTCVQAAVGLVLVRGRRSQFGFALLYMAFFMRLLAAALTPFNPNDEARISAAFGLGPWSLPVLVAAVLFGCVFVASRRLELTFRDQLVSYLVASVVVSLVVFGSRAMGG